MGDYNNQLALNDNGGDGLESVTISDEYSSNGDYCAKILTNGSNSAYARYRINGATNVSEYLNKTITFQANIKTTLPINLTIYYLTDNYVSTNVNVPSGAEGLFTVSVTVPEDCTRLLFSIDVRQFEPVTVYTDGWCLTLE